VSVLVPVSMPVFVSVLVLVLVLVPVVRILRPEAVWARRRTH
jgi:hypothetical protein